MEDEYVPEALGLGECLDFITGSGRTPTSRTQASGNSIFAMKCARQICSRKVKILVYSVWTLAQFAGFVTYRILGPAQTKDVDTANSLLMNAASFLSHVINFEAKNSFVTSYSLIYRDSRIGNGCGVKRMYIIIVLVHQNV